MAAAEQAPAYSVGCEARTLCVASGALPLLAHSHSRPLTSVADFDVAIGKVHGASYSCNHPEHATEHSAHNNSDCRCLSEGVAIGHPQFTLALQRGRSKTERIDKRRMVSMRDAAAAAAGHSPSSRDSWPHHLANNARRHGASNPSGREAHRALLLLPHDQPPQKRRTTATEGTPLQLCAGVADTAAALAHLLEDIPWTSAPATSFTGSTQEGLAAHQTHASVTNRIFMAEAAAWGVVSSGVGHLARKHLPSHIGHSVRLKKRPTFPVLLHLGHCIRMKRSMVKGESRECECLEGRTRKINQSTSTRTGCEGRVAALAICRACRA